MNIEYLVIIFLILLVLILIFLIRHKIRLFEQERALKQRQFEQQLSEQEAEASKYQKQVTANLEKLIPYGERLLIRKFLSLFEKGIFDDVVIYYHLVIETNPGFRQVDFFIASPKGLFIIESKLWKGTTYIYGSTFPDMFQKTQYSSFGVGSSEKIRVFNAQQSATDAGQIQLSTYNNPVAQVREYSMLLLKVLNEELIKNVVVFRAADEYEVMFNNKPLDIIEIDNYTSIITDTVLEKFFVSLRSTKTRETIKVIENIEKNLKYRFKIDKNNYQQAPFSSI